MRRISLKFLKLGPDVEFPIGKLRYSLSWFEPTSKHMKILLYTSVSTLPVGVAEEVVANIVVGSRARNLALSVTGCLLFSGLQFAQCLEGSGEAVDALMVDIFKDSRHCGIKVLFSAPIAARRFPDWVLGYSGRANIIDKIISNALSKDPTGALATPPLISIMSEFAA